MGSLLDSEASTYPDIKRELIKEGNVGRIKMWQLRDANDNQKLGVNVIEDISQKLRDNGIGHVGDLKTDQWEEARLYVIDSPFGTVLESLGHFSTASDLVINSAASAQDRLDAARKALG